VAYKNDLANSGYSFVGLPQDVIVEYFQRGFLNTTTNAGLGAVLNVICKNAMNNPVGTPGSHSSDLTNVQLGVSGMAQYIDKSSVGLQRFIMAGANANNTNYIGAATLWSMNNISGRAPEDAQSMWVKYLG
jgi:hypothetical protein